MAGLKGAHLVSLEDLGETVTLEQLCLPHVNANHTHRVSLFRDKKERSTTMPLVLYAAFKLKYLIQHGKKADYIGSKTDIHKCFRHLLADIQQMIRVNGLEKEVMVSKTFHEILFQHIINDSPLVISDVSQLRLNVDRNRAHTVSGNNYPSLSIPGYVCRWMLAKNGLSTESSYDDINVEVKRLAQTVYSAALDGNDSSLWQPVAGFSRRVQNQLFWKAFKATFTDAQLEMALINPVIEKNKPPHQD